MSAEYELETGAVVSWVDGVDPEDWRDLPDPDGDEDGIENDEWFPTPQYVIDVLGFDPDEFDEGEEEGVSNFDGDFPSGTGDSWDDDIEDDEDYFDEVYRKLERQVSNVFCPTGKGGGKDPTCSPGRSAGMGLMPDTDRLRSYSISMSSEVEERVLEYAQDFLKGFSADDQKSLQSKKAASRTLVAVVGAPEGSQVSITKGGGDSLIVKFKLVDDNGDVVIRGERSLIREGSNTILYNTNFHVSEDRRGEGLGTAMLAQQVAYSRRYGIGEIRAVASGYDGDVGYYAWPRIGYDGDVSGRHLSALRLTAPRNPKDPISKLLEGESFKLSDVFRTKRGREWWKTNGKTVDVSFDPREGSHSSKVLESYIEERGLVLNVFCPTGKGGGEDPTCSPGGAKRVDGGEAQRRDLAAHDVLEKWSAQQTENKKKWWKLIPGAKLQEGGTTDEE